MIRIKACGRPISFQFRWRFQILLCCKTSRVDSHRSFLYDMWETCSSQQGCFQHRIVLRFLIQETGDSSNSPCLVGKAMDQPLFSSDLNAELSRDSLSHGQIRVGRGSSHHILCSRPFPDGHGCNGPSAGLKNIEESFGRARRDMFLNQRGTKGRYNSGPGCPTWIWEELFVPWSEFAAIAGEFDQVLLMATNILCRSGLARWYLLQHTWQADKVYVLPSTDT